MKIRVLRSARRTIADGISFYEGLGAGLGAYFLDSIMSDVRSLAVHAGTHQKHGAFYRKVCERFPYSIYYKAEGSEVSVYAVLDDRRDPRRRAMALDE